MADFRKHTGMWGYVINRSFWRFATFMLRKKKNTHTDLVMRILRAAWINRKRSLLPMENIASHINKFWKFLARKHPFKNIQESYMVIKQAPRRSLLPLPTLRECFQSTIFISYMSLVFIIRKKKFNEVFVLKISSVLLEIICWKFHIIASFPFWDMSTWYVKSLFTNSHKQ